MLHGTANVTAIGTVSAKSTVHEHDGKKYCRFRLVVQRDSEYPAVVYYCECRGNLAEVANDLKDGDRVFVSGTHTAYSWHTRDKEETVSYKIIVSTLMPVDKAEKKFKPA